MRLKRGKHFKNRHTYIDAKLALNNTNSIDFVEGKNRSPE